MINGATARLGQNGGNPCLLWSFDAPPPDVLPATTAITQCQSWPVSHGGETAIAVRCYGASGQLIQCCGHGLLAAAHAWQRRLGRDSVWLVMNNSAVFSWRKGELTWLRFDLIPTQPHPVPDWVAPVLGGLQAARAAALAGDARGYLVLQWPDDFDLAQLQRPATALAGHTARAVICTAVQSESEGRIQLRYFAPQYGVDEDIATGSAMRILADYWYPRFDHLTAYQCSFEGGWLFSRRTATHVEVGGHCVFDASEQLNA